MKRTRFCNEPDCRSSNATLDTKGFATAAMRYLFYCGLSAVAALGSGCGKKAVQQETPRVNAASSSPKAQNSILKTAIVIPLNRACGQLTGDAETKGLCPAPLQFAVSSQSESVKHSFSADIDIKKAASPMHRVRIFSYGELVSINGLLGIPNDSESLNFTERMESDPYSVILSSSAPKDEFKLNVSTTEKLQLKCINQED